MVLQWPIDGADDAAISMNSWLSMRPAASSSRAFQIAMPEPQRSPFHQPLSIGPPDSTIAGVLTVAAAIRQAGVVLSQPVSQHDAVERIAVQHLDQAEISEIAVERGGRALARLLDRMTREFERDAAGRPDAFAHALGQFEMVAVAGRQIRAGLRDADDRLAGAQFLAGQAVVEIALEIERRHAGILGIVEPELRAQWTRARFRRIAQLFRHSQAPGTPIFSNRGCAEQLDRCKKLRPSVGSHCCMQASRADRGLGIHGRGFAAMPHKLTRW